MNTITITLTQNKEAIVDSNMSMLANYKWQYDQKTGYAKRKFTIDGKRKSVYLHLMVYELSRGEKAPKGMVVDHINNNRLDCTSDNLRLATYSQNNVNKVTKVGKSGVKGVTQQGMKFIAKIQFKGVVYKVGKFDTTEEAREAWLAKAAELQGEFLKVQ